MSGHERTEDTVTRDPEDWTHDEHPWDDTESEDDA